MAGSFQNEIPAARINLKLDVGKGNAKKKLELPLKTLVVGDFTQKKRTQRVGERERHALPVAAVEFCAFGIGRILEMFE